MISKEQKLREEDTLNKMAYSQILPYVTKKSMVVQQLTIQEQENYCN